METTTAAGGSPPGAPVPAAGGGGPSRGTTTAGSGPDGTPAGHFRAAAHELFARQGLGVPLADVAKAAGLGVATLYRRYRDKDILILDVYREHMGVPEGLARTANDYGDPWEGIKYFLLSSTEHLMQDRGMRELVLGGYIGGAGWARTSTHEELLAALDDMEGKVTVQLEILVDRARANRSVRADFRPTDLLLMTAMAHAASPTKATDDPVTSRRALQLLMEGIRPPGH